MAEVGGVSDSGGGPKVVIVDPAVLHDLVFIFETDAGWNKDVGAARTELQKD